MEPMPKHTIKGYGWKKSLPDINEKMFMPNRYLAASLPSMVDMRPQCPKIYDQLQLGSCTANAIGGLGEFLMMKEGHHAFTPSRLFIYYNERVIEGTVNEDAGAEIKDGMAVVANQGCPPEAEWWYNINKFTVKASKKVYADGLKHRVSQYSRVNNVNLNDMKTCLATGFPIVIGFSVYQSFESNQVAQTGIVPMPKHGEQMLGGHAVMICGFKDDVQRFIVRNSWGTGWGQAGYFEIPYLYFTNPNLASDAWTAQLIS